MICKYSSEISLTRIDLSELLRPNNNNNNKYNRIYLIVARRMYNNTDKALLFVNPFFSPATYHQYVDTYSSGGIQPLKYPF